MNNFKWFTANSFWIKQKHITNFNKYYFSKKWTIWVLDEFVINQESFDLLPRINYDEWQEHVPYLPTHTKLLLIGHPNHVVPVYRELTKMGQKVWVFII